MGDPNWLRIIRCLVSGPTYIADFAAATDTTAIALKHARCGLEWTIVSATRVVRKVLYRMLDAAVVALFGRQRDRDSGRSI